MSILSGKKDGLGEGKIMFFGEMPDWVDPLNLTQNGR